MLFNKNFFVALLALIPLTIFSINNKNNYITYDELKTIEKLLRQYVRAEELRDKETQFRILAFPNLKGRENSPFEIYDKKKYTERIDGMLKRSPLSIINIYDLKTKLLGKNFVIAEFNWDFSYPNSKDLYVGRGYTFFEKRDGEWKILIQYDIDY